MKNLFIMTLLLSSVVYGAKTSSLRERVSSVLKNDLYQALKEQPTLLPAGEAEIILALLVKAESIPIRIEEIADIAKGSFEDRDGQPALLSDDKSRMLDSLGVPCQARIVRVVGTRDFFIQLDEGIWSELLSQTDSVAPAVIRLLFHEVIRLEWHRGRITTSDERSLVSNQLQLKRASVAPADFATAPIGEGDEFVGQMSCDRSTFKEERVFDFALGGPHDFRRCQVRVSLKKGDTARYEVVLLADSRPYFLVESAHYSIEGGKMTFRHAEDLKVFDIGLNGDHISNIGDTLFRVDRGVPSVLGKNFGAEMFCEVAETSLRQRWSYWEPLHPGFNIYYEKICTLELIINPSGDYMAVLRGEGPVPNVTAGRVEQIGHNLLLHVKDAEADWVGAYFWIVRGRDGHELISTWGETIFENSEPQRQAVFPLANEYRGEGNCGFFPGKERGENEPCKLTLKINYPAEGLAELELESIKDGLKHTERGVANRSGSLYSVLHFEKIRKPWNWRILKDQLADGFGNLLNAVKPTPAPLAGD